MPSPPDPPEAKHAMKALVFEPDSGAREGMESRLKERGHAVTSVAGADLALAAAEAERPALLILDWTGAEGPRLCRRIRESDWGGRCVILASGLRDRTSDLQAALKAGADDHFAKSTGASRIEARLSLAEKRVREIEDRAQAEDEFRRLQRAVGDVLVDITDKELGVHLDVGHLGSGKSLLSFLPRSPVGRLKLDASLVTKGKQPALIKALVALAHDLGISVLADQVESPDATAGTAS